MAIPGGASSPPATALPKTERGKFLFEKGVRFDLSLVATLVVLGAATAWFIGFALLRSPFWYVGLALWFGAVAVFVLWKQ